MAPNMVDLVSLLTQPDVGNEAQDSHAARALGFHDIVRTSFGKTDEQIDLAAHFCALVVELVITRRLWTFSPDAWRDHPPSLSMLRDTARSMPGVGTSGDGETRKLREMRFRLLCQKHLAANDANLDATQLWALKRLRDASPADQIAAMHAIVSTMRDPVLS